MARADRQRAYRAGHAGEDQACWLLRAKGFRILARRQRTPLGEIDIVARRGRLVIFVEVKARATFERAAEAIDARQQQRITRAAEAHLARNPSLSGLDVRFDAILVVPGKFPRHIVDAWRA